MPVQIRRYQANSGSKRSVQTVPVSRSKICLPSSLAT